MKISIINEKKRIPIIIAVLISSAILILFFVANFYPYQFWTYKDGMDCYKQNVGKIKLIDADFVVLEACYSGYGEDGLEYDFKRTKAGRCIVRNVSRFFSINSGLEVLNECTGDNGDLYIEFEQQLLYPSLVRQQEASQEAERRRRLETMILLDINRKLE